MADEIGADLYGQTTAGGSSRDGLTVEAKKPKVVYGSNPPLFDPRLFTYDRGEALSKTSLPWGVTMDSQMPAKEAGQKLEQLFTMYRLTGAQPVVQEAFLNAICFAHTLNSASVLQPGRTKFGIGGNAVELDFSAVVQYLGNDMRRFFRAYANVTRAVNKRVLEEACNSTDIECLEKAEWLLAAAAKRGMQRHPDLTHDTADACWGLTDSERACLVASKTTIFGSGPNMADRNRPRAGQSESAVTGSMYEDPTARAHALADHK